MNRISTAGIAFATLLACGLILHFRRERGVAPLEEKYFAVTSGERVIVTTGDTMNEKAEGETWTTTFPGQ